VDCKEEEQYKALYFDLSVDGLRKYFSQTNPRDAYRKLRRFLTAHSFSHEQYSGYHSCYRTTDLEIFDLMRKLGKEYPWMTFCVNRFEVTNYK